MFDKLQIFRMAQALAVHSSARQAEIAANVANADTPGYRARDVTPFTDFFPADQAGAMRATRPQHFGMSALSATRLDTHETAGAAAPNGNTVSLEAEMMKSVEVKQAHETALSVYEAARNILRASLGRAQ